MWWQKTAWTAPYDFGPVVMPLDQALRFIVIASFFWTNA
ncbi:hypothetical protein N826_31310 [Skermanella aerolata KACC 11604]|nr:hypothetical protein N826_31310 [Skermanella aerolata KACC 11604]